MSTTDPASTKCVTLGTCSILVGTLFITVRLHRVQGPAGGFFPALTSPVSAHAISRGAHKAGIKLWKDSFCDALEERDKEARQ
jgi:multicomponent Na+:H+ antiporter subunit G